MSSETILVVDDDIEVRSLVSDVLLDEGYKTDLAKDAHEALSLIKTSVPDLIFLDLWIDEDEVAGLKIFEKVHKLYREIPIVIISGHGTIDIAVQAIRKGAFDFIEKPFVIDRLLLTCKRALEVSKLKKENSILKYNRFCTEIFSIGESQFASSIKSIVEKIASINSRVFIKSKVGMDTDAIAFEIHRKSSRKEFPFVHINCFSDDGEKFETGLFGTEKSYGHIEEASSGTLFLDDITKLTKRCQMRLLQFLNDESYFAGKRKSYPDVRIICSSNEDIDSLLSNKFSNELFYRLNIVGIDIPSIKDRKEDIMPIIDYYMSNSQVIFGLKSKNFTESSVAILQSYDWPGNIYQIKNVVESSLINSSEFDEIDKDSLPPELISNAKDKLISLSIAGLISLPIKEAKEYFESDYLRAQIDRFSGNISKTATFIGMERSALHRKLKSLGIKSNKKNA